jgi:hypothetical protein
LVATGTGRVGWAAAAMTMSMRARVGAPRRAGLCRFPVPVAWPAGGRRGMGAR